MKNFWAENFKVDYWTVFKECQLPNRENLKLPQTGKQKKITDRPNGGGLKPRKLTCRHSKYTDHLEGV
jgi:hypothetical protein